MKDTQLDSLIHQESSRQEQTLDLIPSENIASTEVRNILASPLVNKYSEGYPGKRYYPGNTVIDEIENLARMRALKLFGLDPDIWSVNVQPYSGAPANLAVYAALMNPGDTLMGMVLSSGGHLSHGHRVSATSKFWNAAQYKVGQDGLIDYDDVAELANESKPKVIVSGFTAYPRIIQFTKFGQIAKSIGAYHMADISHIAGLVASGVHPSPFNHADVVTTTTHKTLRGPRGAMIFSRKTPLIDGDKSLADAIDKAVFPGLQGGPHDNVTAAIAQALFEADTPEFKSYSEQIVKNAQALAEALKAQVLKLISDGTDNHLILADAGSLGLDGRTAEKKLESKGIIANRNTIPGDTSPFKPSGLRLGTPTLTTRGMKEPEMIEVADLIIRALKDENVSEEVKSLTSQFPTPS